MMYEYTNRREVLKLQHFSFFYFTAGACAPACCAKTLATAKPPPHAQKFLR